MQMAFFKGLSELFKSPPAWLRMPAKRGTFFKRLDPSREPSSALPKLLKRWVRRSGIVCRLLSTCWCPGSLSDARQVSNVGSRF